VTQTALQVVERHRVEQLSIRARFVRELLRLWPLINVGDLDRSALAWIEAVADLILLFRKESASRALRYYSTVRLVETGEALPDIDLYENFGLGDPNRIRTSLLVTGPVAFKQRIARGIPEQQAWDLSQADVAGAASRHVLNGGREMVMDAAKKDEVALRFARVTGDDPCAFCAMLASRGPEYLSEFSATTAKAGSARAGQSFHDRCQCTILPLFDENPANGWTDRSLQFSKLWADSTKGWSGTNALNAFRRALDAGKRENTSK
jgi:hypothetical protein